MSHHSSPSLQGVLRNPGSERPTCEPTGRSLAHFLFHITRIFRSARDSNSAASAVSATHVEENTHGIHDRLQNNGMLICKKTKEEPFRWIKFREVVVNIACFHRYGAEIFCCEVHGAIYAWCQHRGHINWEGTRWERKILAKQLEGVQENKKQRRAIMSYTSGLPSSWRWTSSATVAFFKWRKCLLWLQMLKGLPAHYSNTHFLMYYACLLSIFLPDNGEATKAHSHGRPVFTCAVNAV